MKNIRKKKIRKEAGQVPGENFYHHIYKHGVSALHFQEKKKTISNISHSVSLKQDVMNIIKSFALNLMFVQYSQLSSCHWKLFVPSTD